MLTTLTSYTMYRNTALFLLSFLALSAMSAPGFRADGNTITVATPAATVRLQLCGAATCRVTKSATADMPRDERLMVVKYEFAPVERRVAESDTAVTVTTAAMRLTVSKRSALVSVSTATGTPLYAEHAASLASPGEGPTTTCALSPDEHFFGFGERMDRLDQRGQRIHLNVELGHGPKPAVGGKDILRANYCPVPFFMSSRGYAVFFHTAYPTDWDMGWTSASRYTFKADGGALDYYIMVGETPQRLLHAYQTLTGFCPLMPRAAYGLHVGSYSGGTWKHETETSAEYPVRLVERLRREKIPFDLLWLDSTWRHFGKRFGNGGCSFEFRETFRDPQAMIDSIYANHVAMFGLHVRSIVDDGQHNTLFEDAAKAGALHPGADCPGVINFFDRKAVDWWWKNGVERIAGMGVKFVKTDVGSALRIKRDTTFASDGTTSAERHNLFPLVYAAAPYERFAARNRTRAFTHTREGYAGIQRYPFIWAGDWGTEWQWFEPVVCGGLNAALSGVGNWGHCMGGFEQYSPYDTDLYLRWCQFGMLSPVAMLFGMDHPRYHEPWTYGEEAQRIFTQYDLLRYSLLPYIYSNAWLQASTSRPLIAPLLFDWPRDERTYNITDQYLFGPALMVCPVTAKGALSRPVYFPGGEWVDYWTGERIRGRQYKSFLTPQELMPMFLREGAIIPCQEPTQWVGERPTDVVTLLCVPSATPSSYDMYEDDGSSDDYKTGRYATTRITTALNADGSMCLTIAKPEGRYTPERHEFTVEAYLDRKPAAVTVCGTPLEEGTQWHWDDTRRRLTVTTHRDNTTPITIETK